MILGLLSLGGCSHQRPLRIGVSQCSSDDWRSKMNEEIMREAMLHDDIEVEIRSADDDSQRQIADLQYFVDEDFDIIIAAPNEAATLTPIIREIYDSGRPIILFDRQIDGDSYTAFQGADNAAIGRLAALSARSMAGDGARVVEIRGLRGSSPEQGRHDGFIATAADNGLQIVASAYADWTAPTAARVADSLLSTYNNIDVVYAHNDRMAIAAAEVADSLGLRNVKVIGIDAAPAIGITAVRDSVIDATFLYPTAGGQLIRTALAVLRGEPYERDLILPSPSGVDDTNAELLLLQDQTLREETGKITALKSQLDTYWQLHSTQTAMLYGAILILILLIVIIVLLVRAYWQTKRYHAQIEERNAELSKQRDELHDLYEKLQQATTSKLTFFTNVSHDLRTPLTLIAEPLSQLASDTSLPARQHTMAQLADKNCRRLTRLVNQILDIRRYDSDSLALNRERVDLGSAVSEWATSFTALAGKRNIAFSTDIDRGEEMLTAVDLDKMERVLFNLLSNAFKFTRSGGSINVSLHRDGATYVLRVSDTGQGIPAEDVKQVFDRYFKSDRGNPSGSGIGLALTKIFVEMHGGTIEVDSRVGEGTTFEVRIPRAELPELPEADLAASSERAADDASELATIVDDSDSTRAAGDDAPTVLVIDDNADIRTLLRSILADRYTVLQAASGAQGIRLASKYIPDLIICDVMMPGMDGHQVCRELKGEVVTSHIPVLMLTAVTDNEGRTESYTSGADGYMSKPFDSSMLLARCESLIANRKRILTSMGSQPARSQSAASAATARPVSTQSPAAEGDVDSEFFARFTTIVEAEMSRSELSVEDLASQLGLSRVQLYRKIKALTGYAPAELLRNMRLERAAVLLKTTEATVSEVAYTVGFTAPNHFTRCYKQLFGELPSATQQRTSHRK